MAHHRHQDRTFLVLPARNRQTGEIAGVRHKRSQHRRRDDRVSDLIFAERHRPVGIDFPFARRRRTHGVPDVVGCPDCVERYAAYDGYPRFQQCPRCQDVQDAQWEAITWAVPKVARQLIVARSRAADRATCRRLLQAYREGRTQDDDDRRLEFAHRYRDAGYTYW